jgi:hypothetical protein
MGNPDKLKLIKAHVKKINKMKKDSQKMQDDFKLIISDKETPFKERLQLYIDSPEELMYHAPYLPSRPNDNRRIATIWKEVIANQGDCGGRGQQCYISWILEESISCYLNGDDDMEEYGYFEDGLEFEEFMEDVFSKNLGSFIFDW